MSAIKEGQMIPLFKVFVHPDVPSLVSEVLASGYIGQGPLVEKFEEMLRAHFRVDEVNTVNSCTSALQLAVHLISTGNKWQPGDEVLTTPLTCTATNFAILATGAKLRWVDVDLTTANMDLDDLERKLSPKTKAIMVVHWGGYPVDLDRLKAIQEKCYKLYGFRPPVIEDCAHAWESTYKGDLIGTHGNYAAFSFQAIKHFTTGDGGMLITPTRQEHERAKLMRWFGLDRTGSADFRCAQNIKEWGFKFHMNDINAAVGVRNFPHVSPLVKRHQENSDFLYEKLANVPGITLLENKPDRKSAAWIFTMRVEKRDTFKKTMEARGIHTSQVHARNDVHDCLQEFRAGLPNMDILDTDMICIPNGWWVTDEDRQYIVDQIKAGW